MSGIRAQNKLVKRASVDIHEAAVRWGMRSLGYARTVDEERPLIDRAGVEYQVAGSIRGSNSHFRVRHAFTPLLAVLFDDATLSKATGWKVVPSQVRRHLRGPVGAVGSISVNELISGGPGILVVAVPRTDPSP